MAPISAAKALPERPATMIAVSSTPSSRSTPTVTRSTTKMSAPNLLQLLRAHVGEDDADQEPISETIGTAVMPVS